MQKTKLNAENRNKYHKQPNTKNTVVFHVIVLTFWLFSCFYFPNSYYVFSVFPIAFFCFPSTMVVSRLDYFHLVLVHLPFFVFKSLFPLVFVFVVGVFHCACTKQVPCVLPVCFFGLFFFFYYFDFFYPCWITLNLTLS